MCRYSFKKLVWLKIVQQLIEEWITVSRKGWIKNSIWKMVLYQSCYVFLSSLKCLWFWQFCGLLGLGAMIKACVLDYTKTLRCRKRCGCFGAELVDHLQVIDSRCASTKWEMVEFFNRVSSLETGNESRSFWFGAAGSFFWVPQCGTAFRKKTKNSSWIVFTSWGQQIFSVSNCKKLWYCEFY